MGRNDWYRRKTWTVADQKEFWARLKRSRTAFHRAQYIRIQAVYLEEVGEIRPAITLLQHVVTEYQEASQLVAVKHQLGTCHAKLGDFDTAFNFLRESVALEDSTHGSRSYAWLDFGRMAVELDRTELYAEFLRMAEDGEFLPGERSRSAGLTFPVDRYYYYGITALIRAAHGDHAEGQELAKRAIQAAESTHSGFERHPGVGLVADDSSPFRMKVEALANAAVVN